VYGDPNPVFTFSYSGFVNGDDDGDIVPPTASTTANQGSCIGTYPITLNGGSAANYNLIFDNGVLTITKATLIVKADTKFLYKGGSIPTRTSTITGWKNNDQNTITSGPSYTVPSSCNLTAGVYPITVCCLNFPNKTSYNIVYQSGLLYVNPKGYGAKKITVSLSCIDTLINDPSGLQYEAHFTYCNSNSTALYIPVSTDNSVTTTGTYSGVQPIVFAPGIGNYDVKFSGQPITWSVKSYQGSTKYTVSATASSSSTKCSGYGTRMGEETTTATVSAYPNPVHDLLRISIAQDGGEVENLTITDMLGKAVQLPMTIESNNTLLDCSSLQQGVYMVRVTFANRDEVVRIVKE
jgi:hypothetical protein